MTVRRSPFSVPCSLSKQVESELAELLALSRQGKLTGLVWAVEGPSIKLRAGAAGAFKRDGFKAAGALLHAAILKTGAFDE